jgi:disulfide bond formation protein DsbB
MTNLLALFSSPSAVIARVHFRWLAAVLAVVCVGLVVAAIIISSVENLQPCPLCIMQRMGFLLVGIVAVVGVISPPSRLQGRRVVVGLALIPALVSLGIASWHVYLQYAPPSFTCGPDLEFMMTNWPLAKWLPAVFRGSGDCAKIDWSLLGLSMPLWSAVCFLLIVAACVIYLLRQKH